MSPATADVSDQAPPFVVQEPEWLAQLEREERRSRFFLPVSYFSFNQYRQVLECPACYEARYILRRPLPVHISLFKGSAVHAGHKEARIALRSAAAEQAEPQEVAEQLHLFEMTLDAGAKAWSDRLAGIDDRGTPEDPLPPTPPEVDFGSLITSKRPASRTKAKVLGQQKDHALSMLKVSLSRIVLKEPHVRYSAVEAQLDYPEDLFPFDFVGYLDVGWQLEDGTYVLQDDKTTAKPPHKPGQFMEQEQLCAYALPAWHYGARWQGQIGQVAETGTKKEGTNGKPQAAVWPLERATDEQMRWLRDNIIRAAEVVSSGHFPARVDWKCSIEHPRPAFSVVVHATPRSRKKPPTSKQTK